VTTSATYRLCREAMLEQKQVVCRYQGYVRELCPIIIGHTKGEERLLVYQFGGGSKSGLPPEGAWNCLRLAEVHDLEPRDGPWREGGSHQQQQRCVEEIDLDVNIHIRMRR
jgi:hypothetical protein